MILVIFIKAVAELGVIPYTHLFIVNNCGRWLVEARDNLICLNFNFNIYSIKP